MKKMMKKGEGTGMKMVKIEEGDTKMRMVMTEGDGIGMKRMRIGNEDIEKMR